MPASALQGAGIAAAALFALTQALLLAYSAHRLLTLRRWALARRRPSRRETAPERWPKVTVQLPVHDESAVVERLIDAAAGLDYPAGLLQIQILDDSTDDTTVLALARAAHWRGRGVDIQVIHRRHREGFKAGALAAGLRRASGEILVVFDADFVPPTDFLRRIVPRFSDPRVGMVQARWGHLNRGRSALTTAQAVLLDAHFLLEHEARASSGLFLNFNGTAGAWRRACIEDAGGWSSDTLTEDLDLSYRAQSKGWRFVSAPDVVVPAELPGNVLALKTQQRRWAKGSIQTARKVLPGILRGAQPARVKLEALAHLTANASYPLLLLSVALLPAVLLLPNPLPGPFAGLIDAGALTLGVLPIVAFLAAGQFAGSRGAPRGLPAALLVCAGLTLNNSLAVLDGLRRPLGRWERTPKTGENSHWRGRDAYSHRRDPAAALELLLAALCIALAAFAWQQGRAGSIPFLLLLAAGLGYVGARSLAGAGARPGAA